MSKTKERESTRKRKSTLKFGIDDFEDVVTSYSRKSRTSVKTDSISNCSSKQSDEQNIDKNKTNRMSLRSKSLVKYIESKPKSSPKKPKTAVKRKSSERLLQELNESITESDLRRSKRSKVNKTPEKEETDHKISPKSTPKLMTKTKISNNSTEKLLKTNKSQSKVQKDIKPKNKNKEKKKSFDANKDWLNVALKRLSSNAIPDSLPCRESQFKDIFQYVESKLSDGVGGCMYISGVPGTGKTATVHEVRRKLESSDKYPNFTFIEVNGLKLSDPFQSYVQILRELTGEKKSSYQSADILNDRFSNCDPNNEFVILLVDELDLLRTRKQNILYHLFDWPTRLNSKLIVLTIANSMDLPEKLMINRVSSRLGLTRLSFHPYSYKELEAIIKSRLEGLPEIFDCDALQLICRKVAAVSGDARRALDICRLSVEMAQMDNEKTVSMSCVDSALKEIFNSLKLVRIRRAPLQEKLFLQSIVQEFRISGVEESDFIHIYKHHIEMCQFEGHYTPSTVELEKLAYNLHSCRLIIIENGASHLTKRIRLNVSVDDINFALRMDDNNS